MCTNLNIEIGWTVAYPCPPEPLKWGHAIAGLSALGIYRWTRMLAVRSKNCLGREASAGHS